MHELCRNFRSLILVGMPVRTVSPIHSCKCVVATTFGVLHGQKCWEVMLLRVARVDVQARQLKFPPKSLVLDHEQRVPLGQDIKLRSNSELLERHFREHHIVSPSNVALREVGIIGEDFDETSVI